MSKIKWVVSAWFVAAYLLGFGAKYGITHVFPESGHAYFDAIVGFIPSTETYSKIMEPLDVALSIIILTLTFPLVFPSYVAYLQNKNSVFEHTHLKFVFLAATFASVFAVYVGIDLGSEIGFAKIFYALASFGFLGCISFFFVLFNGIALFLAYWYCIRSSDRKPTNAA